MLNRLPRQSNHADHKLHNLQASNRMDGWLWLGLYGILSMQQRLDHA